MIQVEFLKDFSSPGFGEVTQGDKCLVTKKQADLLIIRGLAKILKPKKVKKDGQ
jgi:hypothetical protein